MYRTVDQIDNIMLHLASSFPWLCTRRELPHRTEGDRPVYALKIAAGGGSGRRGFLAIGGVHAREYMNPDAIIELAGDLVRSYLLGQGITYKGSASSTQGRKWSAQDVRLMVETLDIWLIPTANPDGRQYAMDEDDMWRMNRHDNLNSPCVGVDVNRNFDIAWATITSATSCDVCNPYQTYCGPAAFSEPEARNIRTFCETFKVNVFVDVHSFKELIMYPWGHARLQTTTPGQNFTTLASGSCALLNPPTYQEYIPSADLRRYQVVAQRVVNSVRMVRGRNYTPQPIHSIYPTGASGTSSDYVYSQHLRNPGLQKTYAFAFECGQDTDNDWQDFHPSDATRLADTKKDTKAAILTLIEQTICAIEFVGVSLFDNVRDVKAIRALRDETLATTDAGQGWLDLFDRVQRPVLAIVLEDEKLQREAAELLGRATELIERNSSKLTAADTARARRFVRALSRRIEDPKVKRDLAQVQKRLTAAQGRTVSRVVATLMREAPAAVSPKRTRRPAKRGTST